MSNKIILEKAKLNASISYVCNNSRDFVKDPDRNFTRNRKLTLRDVLSVLLSKEGGSLTKELFQYFGCNQKIASVPAFIQQRQKFNEKAFPALFERFAKYTDRTVLYKGFRLFAADGSDIHIPLTKNHSSSYFPGVKNREPYNLLHLDAVYDLLQHTYVDIDVCGRKEYNEKKALIDMIGRSQATSVLIIADRNYENYNLMAHIQEKCWKCLIRTKDIGSTGILSGLELPETDEFDMFCPMHLTRRRTAEVIELQKRKNEYKCIASAPLDYLPTGSKKKDPVEYYFLPFRVVRFKISESTYETVITNLDRESFPPEELKKLYNMRWGIETSFRELKHTIGLLYFHAKKVENIFQEIYARIIMYNFSELIISHIIIQKKDTKYNYKVNLAVAVHVCRQFFRGNISPPEVEATISRYTTPIRPGRTFPRKMSIKRSVSFVYRIA